MSIIFEREDISEIVRRRVNGKNEQIEWLELEVSLLEYENETLKEELDELKTQLHDLNTKGSENNS